jgi:hypothetical protein
VVAQWGRGQIGRWRGPGIKVPLVAWVYVLAAALVFHLVLLRVRR